MKKLLFLVAIVLLYDCDKWDNCVGIISGKSDSSLISKEQAAIVKSLFESNNIKSDNLQCYRLSMDLGYSVRCYQYANNLRLINRGVVFNFDKQGRLGAMSGDTISHVSVVPNPSMNIKELKTIFIDTVNNDDHLYQKNVIRNKCITCELGYYDMNRGRGISDEPDFVLAWKVKPDGVDAPYAIINDSQKSLITYFNGIYID